MGDCVGEECLGWFGIVWEVEDVVVVEYWELVEFDCEYGDKDECELEVWD